VKQRKLDFALPLTVTSTESGSSGAAEVTNYLSAASSTSPSYTSSSSADVKLLAASPTTTTELEHTITEDVVVLRKGTEVSAASETNDTEMVMGLMASSADSEEKGMILLHSATATPSSTPEAEPQASSVECPDSPLPEKESRSDGSASFSIPR
jgi:hypothetical protein